MDERPKVVDLMEALEASLAAVKAERAHSHPCIECHEPTPCTSLRDHRTPTCEACKSQPVPVEPETTYRMDTFGGSGAVMDAIYTGPGVRRVVEDIGPSYTTEAQEGETHVQFSIRVPGVEGGPFYIDSDA